MMAVGEFALTRGTANTAEGRGKTNKNQLSGNQLLPKSFHQANEISSNANSTQNSFAHRRKTLAKERNLFGAVLLGEGSYARLAMGTRSNFSSLFWY